MTMLNKYHCILQNDITDCGPACLATISRQYGLRIPISKIREAACTDKDGTNLLGLVKAARVLNFDAKPVRGEIENINEQLPTPFIAHVVIEGLLHFVVVHEIKKDRLIVADPAVGIVKYTKEEFAKIWTGVLVLVEPTEYFEKRDETDKIFDRFLHFYKLHKKLVFDIVIAALVVSVFGLLGTFYYKLLIDYIFYDKLRGLLVVFTVGMILLKLFQFVLQFFQAHISLFLTQKLNVSLILNYFRHVLHLPMSFFDSRRVGEITSRIGDAQIVLSAVTSVIFAVLIDLIMAVGGGIMVFAQNSTLFFTALSLYPLTIIIVFAFNPLFRKLHRKEMKANEDVNSFMIESLNGIQTIKSTTSEENIKNELEIRFMKYYNAVFKHNFWANIENMIKSFLSSFNEMILMLVGGFMLIDGKITLGQLITFNAIFAYFYAPVYKIIGLQPVIQRARVSGERLSEIFDIKQETDPAQSKAELCDVKGEIVFDNVSFQYGTRKKVLENINLSIKPGQKVAFVGESGSGKTTLAKLVMKLYEPTDGNIMLDNVNLKDISTDSIRKSIGYIPQETFLFSDPVHRNIRLGVNDITFNEIIEASIKANAHEFIDQMPLRYDSLVGERGSSLSGGQRQRISIARLILKNAPINILDEATSALDTLTEESVQQTIFNTFKDRTMIIIAHRLSTIRSCDNIVFIDKGRIIESGTHDELVALKGRYYNMCMRETGSK